MGIMLMKIDRLELHTFLRQRKPLRGQDIEISCDSIDAIPYLDIYEFYLFLSGAKNWIWRDARGRILERLSVHTALSHILLDGFSWSYLYYHIYAEVTNLLKKTSVPAQLGPDSSLLFIRSDHWFNIKSGGSVGHLSGVIGGFRAAQYKTYVVSTDHLMEVPPDDFYLCSPIYARGRNLPNFPEILYHHQLLKFITQHWINKWKPTFIYQRYSLGNYSGVALKWLYRIPYICEYNGSFIWMFKQWDKRKYLHEGLLNRIELLNLHAADLVVVVSKAMKDDLAQRGIASDKILVNPNGVDPERYSPEVDGSPVRHRYGLENKTVIGFIGTFGPWHGAAVLVEAFGCLLQEHPEYRGRLKLLMIGDGVTRPQVDAAISGYNLADDCILTGLVPQDQGPIYLAACDILASPHVPNPDGTPFFGSPTKLFEYMAMGKGIAASDLNQIGEILCHKETAWMVKPGDTMALMLGLKALADDGELRRSLGQAARQEVLAHYTWRAHTQRILDEIHNRCG